MNIMFYVSHDLCSGTIGCVTQDVSYCMSTGVCRKSASRPGYDVKVRPDLGMMEMYAPTRVYR